MSFDSKIVIVTGSSSGIGAATAIKFAKEGAHVVLVGRNELKLKNVTEQCEKIGKKPLVFKADITKEDEAKTVINKTIENFGKLDVLVNNAGTTSVIDILSENFMEHYDYIINVNLRAVVYLTHLAIPHLMKSKGNIVNVSSFYGTSCIGSPDMIPYRTSKAGLNHFSRSLAAKLAPNGVRVNIVSPGPVRTDLMENSSITDISWDMIKEITALQRVSDPEEIADVILFLACDKSKGITGADFVSDNGVLIKC